MLCHDDVLRGWLPRISQTGCLDCQKTSGFAIGRHVGDHLLDELVPPNGFAPLLALAGVSNAGVEAGLDDADGAGGCRSAAALQGCLRDLEAVPGFAEEAIAADTHRIEEEGGGVRRVQTELFRDDPSLEAGRVAIDHERGQALVAGAGLRLREDDDNVGDGAVRYPELAPVY